MIAKGALYAIATEVVLPFLAGLVGVVAVGAWWLGRRAGR
jgi:hypothetical protein